MNDQHQATPGTGDDDRRASTPTRSWGPTGKVVQYSDVARCPIISLSPDHYRDDGTCHCQESWATREFNMLWCNDQDLYLDVIAYARECLRQVPGMTEQTLGRNIKDRVYSWHLGGGYGYDNPRKHVRALEYLGRVAYAEVQEERVADEVLELLPIEGYDAKTGNVL